MKYGIEDCYNRSSERDARASRIGIGGVVKASGQQVTLRTPAKSVSGASMIGILSLGLKKGSEVEVAVEGDNEQAVLDEVVAAIEAITD